MRTLALVALLAACGSGDPKITRISINPTHAKPIAHITMTLEVENFTLDFVDPSTVHALRAAHEGEGGEGHVHVYFDNLETNPLVQTASTSFPIGVPGDATVGAHTLIARLHSADHLILEPEVTAEVTLTVDP